MTRRPCTECPWVKATPRGQFPPERYAALRGTTGTPSEQVFFDAPRFACHKAPEGEEFDCAGWLAAVGLWHLGVRVLVAQGHLPAEALRPGAGWPELHRSYDELEAVHG